LFLYNMYYVAD